MNAHALNFRNLQICKIYLFQKNSLVSDMCIMHFSVFQQNRDGSSGERAFLINRVYLQSFKLVFWKIENCGQRDIKTDKATRYNLFPIRASALFVAITL